MTPRSPDASSQLLEPAVDYVLPLRWTDDGELADLTAYLCQLSQWVRVIIVDGSPQPIFAGHVALWSAVALVIPPSGEATLNGKVAAVHTGIRVARSKQVVIADDDVRYDRAALAAVVAHLGDADLVGPQNVFSPQPWHARWDTSRSLLNRAFGADYPGTFAIRRVTFDRMGGYSGDVLFENLELMRTVEATGGVVRRPLDLYVERRPPTVRKFLEQRTRQAFDDFAQPAKAAVLLAIAPLALLALVTGRAWLLLIASMAIIGMAERGRRRGGGVSAFPFVCALLAPAWVLERACCIWLASAARLRGGIPYAGGRLVIPAHSVRALRSAASPRAGARPAQQPEILLRGVSRHRRA